MPPGDRFRLLFTFLKRHHKKEKVMVFFSSRGHRAEKAVFDDCRRVGMLASSSRRLEQSHGRRLSIPLGRSTAARSAPNWKRPSFAFTNTKLSALAAWRPATTMTSAPQTRSKCEVAPSTLAA